MMISKEECEQTLATRLHATAVWRSGKAENFPFDKRNAKAAERLSILALDFTISDTVWAVLAPFYNNTDSRWLTAVSDVNRDIGFRRTSKDCAEYVDNLVSKLKTK